MNGIKYLLKHWIAMTLISDCEPPKEGLPKSQRFGALKSSQFQNNQEFDKPLK